MCNKHCNIIKDLLPLYVDELTSEESNHAIEAHLSICESCSEIYKTLKANSGFSTEGGNKELDYLKKIKAKRKKIIALTIILCFLAFSLLATVGVKVYVIGSPVTPSQITYSFNYDEATRELKIKGNIERQGLVFSGAILENDAVNANAIDLTIMGALPFWGSKTAHTQFYKTIKIPDNGQSWSVYINGEGKHDGVMLWNNQEQWEQQFIEPRATLTDYLIANKEFDTSIDHLDANWVGDILNETCYIFGWSTEEPDLEGREITDYAISTDLKTIYRFDIAGDAWIEDKK